MRCRDSLTMQVILLLYYFSFVRRTYVQYVSEDSDQLIQTDAELSMDTYCYWTIYVII